MRSDIDIEKVEIKQNIRLEFAHILKSTTIDTATKIEKLTELAQKLEKIISIPDKNAFLNMEQTIKIWEEILNDSTEKEIKAASPSGIVSETKSRINETKREIVQKNREKEIQDLHKEIRAIEIEIKNQGKRIEKLNEDIKSRIENIKKYKKKINTTLDGKFFTTLARISTSELKGWEKMNIDELKQLEIERSKINKQLKNNPKEKITTEIFNTLTEEKNNFEIEFLGALIKLKELELERKNMIIAQEKSLVRKFSVKEELMNKKSQLLNMELSEQEDKLIESEIHQNKNQEMRAALLLEEYGSEKSEWENNLELCNAQQIELYGELKILNMTFPEVKSADKSKDRKREDSKEAQPYLSNQLAAQVNSLIHTAKTILDMAKNTTTEARTVLKGIEDTIELFRQELSHQSDLDINILPNNDPVITNPSSPLVKQSIFTTPPVNLEFKTYLNTLDAYISIKKSEFGSSGSVSYKFALELQRYLESVSLNTKSERIELSNKLVYILEVLTRIGDPYRMQTIIEEGIRILREIPKEEAKVERKANTNKTNP